MRVKYCLGFKICIASEDAVIVYFEQHGLLENNQKITQLQTFIDNTKPSWLIETVPAYQSLLIYYDPLKTDHYGVYQQLAASIEQLEKQQGSIHQKTSKEVALPVWYAPPVDNDLAAMSKHCQLDTDQIIQLHKQSSYRVFCLGFAPGFAFLGQVDPRIAMPRRSSVRKNVPKGAVAIADQQTAVYPETSPGGWNIIGLCPLTLFDAERQPSSLLNPGDTVRFYSIDQDEYETLGGRL